MAKIIVDEDILMDAYIALERIYVLSDDLAQDYFGYSDGNGCFKDDFFLKSEYERSRVHCEIARSFSYDAKESVKKLLNESQVYKEEG